MIVQVRPRHIVKHFLYQQQVYVKVLFTCTFLTLFVAGVLGNALVIIAVATCRKMRASAMNVLMTNLALTDMCNLIANAPDVTMLIWHGCVTVLLPYNIFLCHLLGNRNGHFLPGCAPRRATVAFSSSTHPFCRRWPSALRGAHFSTRFLVCRGFIGVNCTRTCQAS